MSHLRTFVYHRLKDTLEGHDAILMSIKNHDLDGAAQAMKHHLDQAKDGVIKLFEDGALNFFGGARFTATLKNCVFARTRRCV